MITVSGVLLPACHSLFEYVHLWPSLHKHLLLHRYSPPLHLRFRQNQFIVESYQMKKTRWTPYSPAEKRSGGSLSSLRLGYVIHIFLY